MKVIVEGRKRSDFEIDYDHIHDVLQVVDKKEKKIYHATPAAFLKTLFKIELEEIEYED